MKKFLYLDIDGVIAVGYNTPKLTTWGYVEKWDRKCVKVLNEILEETGAEIIVSSDWKLKFSSEHLIEIFEWQGITKIPLDTTPDSGSRIYQNLEEDRANEILTHVAENNPDTWVAVDDLNLSKWIDSEHFIYLTRWMEGIKQTSKKEKIIEILNRCQK